jgi:hypothetical protein
MDVNEKLSLTKEGDLKAVRTYPGKEVEIEVDDIKHIIGKQADYDIVQVIKKDEVPYLYRFLQQQKNMHEIKLKPNKDYVNQHQHIDPNGKVEEMLKHLTDDKSKKVFKDYKNLDKYSQMVVNLAESKKIMESTEEIISSLQDQLDFIKKNFKI